MATNTTFTTLKQDMQRYLERGGSAVTDPTVFDQLPRLINMTERKLADATQLLGSIEPLIATDSVQLGLPVVTKPDRWRKTTSMAIGTGTGGNTWTTLYPRSLEYCRTYWPDSTATGQPEFYAEMDINHWWVVPTPDANYPLSLLCYMLPRLLDETNQTNFWTQLTPAALLYGCLAETSRFLQDFQMAAQFDQDMQRELAALGEQDFNRIYDRTAKRSTV